MLVLNKLDILRDDSLLPILQRNHPDAMAISARTGRGLAALCDAVDERMRGEQRRLTLSIAARDGRAQHFLERFAEILHRRFENGRAILDVNISPRVLEQLHAIARDVRHGADGADGED